MHIPRRVQRLQIHRRVYIHVMPRPRASRVRVQRHQRRGVRACCDECLLLLVELLQVGLVLLLQTLLVLCLLLLLVCAAYW